jgi:hypothetical protein
LGEVEGVNILVIEAGPSYVLISYISYDWTSFEPPLATMQCLRPIFPASQMMLSFKHRLMVGIIPQHHKSTSVGKW